MMIGDNFCWPLAWSPENAGERSQAGFREHALLLRTSSNRLYFSVVQVIFTQMSDISRKTAEDSREPADRLMTARQLAAYLSLNERTVLKLVSEGGLPGVKIGNQWRFRKAMVDAWLDDQMLGVTTQSVDVSRSAPAARRMLSLASCFQPSHIIPDLEANTKTGVIEELASLASRLNLVRDKTWFVGALIERKNIMPSATGNGLAFLHTLNRHPEHVVKPFMIFGRSRGGIDFDALDGKPTHLFFVLGLKYHELHLPWLAKLPQMCSRPETLRTLMAAVTADSIFAALSDAERDLEISATNGAGRSSPAKV